MLPFSFAGCLSVSNFLLNLVYCSKTNGQVSLFGFHSATFNVESSEGIWMNS